MKKRLSVFLVILLLMPSNVFATEETHSLPETLTLLIDTLSPDSVVSGVYPVYDTSNNTFRNYTDKIDDDLPVILDLNAHPSYQEHWVVGYSYERVGSEDFAITVDGHGSTDASINWDYVGDLVYLAKLRRSIDFAD